MTYFERLAADLPVAPVLQELDAHPELWGQYTERTSAPGSPHADSQDIWLRFRDRSELTEPARYGEPHFPVWYPAAALVPSIKPLIHDLMHYVKAVALGGCMLTRLPPGGRILPHVDDGWHALHYNTKAYIILRANPGCLNHCGNEMALMAAGEAWLFNNLVLHSVENWGGTERVAAIITMRTEP